LIMNNLRVGVYASSLPIPSVPISSLVFPLHIPTLPRFGLFAGLFGLPGSFPVGASPPVTVLMGTDVVFSSLGALSLELAPPPLPPQIFLLSLAHAPQLLIYAPARWPAAPTAACATLKSGARARRALASKNAADLVAGGEVSGELRSANLDGDGRPGAGALGGGEASAGVDGVC
jgi:hypothetical protein